jgi:hypothetical protein
MVYAWPILDLFFDCPFLGGELKHSSESLSSKASLWVAFFHGDFYDCFMVLVESEE